MRIMPIGHGDLSLCPVASEIVFGASRSTFSACSSLLTRPYLIWHRCYVQKIQPWASEPSGLWEGLRLAHHNKESHADQAEELTAEELLPTRG